jgi:hypothetical protein
MPKPRANPAREHRILDEIIVDAYSPDERAMSWYYYLEGKLRFPFEARCMAVRKISPLKKDEQVTVLELAPEDDCMKSMLVIVQFAGRELGVPLDQLEVVAGDEGAREAVEDWRYWVGMGYEF